MSAPDPGDHAAVLSYRCPRCSRWFVAAAGGTEESVGCVCGALLSPAPLPHGVHELCAPLSATARITAPAQAPGEPDGGYGASHGYGPAHGGPSGPGDTPAKSPS